MALLMDPGSCRTRMTARWCLSQPNVSPTAHARDKIRRSNASKHLKDLGHLLDGISYVLPLTIYSTSRNITTMSLNNVRQGGSFHHHIPAQIPPFSICSSLKIYLLCTVTRYGRRVQSAIDNGDLTGLQGERVVRSANHNQKLTLLL